MIRNLATLNFRKTQSLILLFFNILAKYFSCAKGNH